MRTPTFSVEVITLLVSDVERALRFYVDPVGFTLDVDYSPNEAFRVVQLTPPAPAARSRSVTDSPTRPPVHFATSISSSRTLEAARSRLLDRGVEVGEIRQKTPIRAWDGNSWVLQERGYRNV